MTNLNILSRYIPFERFEDICAKGLFLPNSTLFMDSQEGHIAIKSLFLHNGVLDLKNVEIMKSYFYVSSWYSGEEKSKVMWSRFGEVCIETSREQLKNICRKYGENNPTHNIIIRKIEYVSSSDNGISDRELEWEWDYWSEKQYNPQSGHNLCSIKTLQGLFFKYDEFSHEKEVRLICDSFHGIKNKGDGSIYFIRLKTKKK